MQMRQALKYFWLGYAAVGAAIAVIETEYELTLKVQLLALHRQILMRKLQERLQSKQQ
jgi:hypothetical protein